LNLTLFTIFDLTQIKTLHFQTILNLLSIITFNCQVIPNLPSHHCKLKYQIIHHDFLQVQFHPTDGSDYNVNHLHRFDYDGGDNHSDRAFSRLDTSALTTEKIESLADHMLVELLIARDNLVYTQIRKCNRKWIKRATQGQRTYESQFADESLAKVKVDESLGEDELAQLDQEVNQEAGQVNQIIKEEAVEAMKIEVSEPIPIRTFNVRWIDIDTEDSYESEYKSGADSQFLNEAISLIHISDSNDQPVIKGEEKDGHSGHIDKEPTSDFPSNTQQQSSSSTIRPKERNTLVNNKLENPNNRLHNEETTPQKKEENPKLLINDSSSDSNNGLQKQEGGNSTFDDLVSIVMELSHEAFLQRIDFEEEFERQVDFVTLWKLSGMRRKKNTKLRTLLLFDKNNDFSKILDNHTRFQGEKVAVSYICKKYNEGKFDENIRFMAFPGKGQIALVRAIQIAARCHHELLNNTRINQR
jgi:hypothetical protein